MMFQSSATRKPETRNQRPDCQMMVCSFWLLVSGSYAQGGTEGFKVARTSNWRPETRDQVLCFVLNAAVI